MTAQMMPLRPSARDAIMKILLRASAPAAPTPPIPAERSFRLVLLAAIQLLEGQVLADLTREDLAVEGLPLPISIRR